MWDDNEVQLMGPGIRAELQVPGAPECPLARTSAEYDVTTSSLSKSVNIDSPTRVVEEFCVETDNSGPPDLEEQEITKVFERGSQSIYQFKRVDHQNCPCECIEAQGFPVVDVRGVDGSIFLVFHAPDRDTLRRIIKGIREHYPEATVRRLVQSSSPEDEGSLVFFDKSVFTDRQLEILRKAHQQGYFEHPKGANAGEVAEEFDITTATFIQHLSAAQKKLLDSILETE
jgi:predicted DNA binding protein